MDARRPVHTMTVESGVDNVIELVRDTLERKIPGDLIEAGVWKGGLPILMRGVLKAYGDTQRRVWVADSFCGVPHPKQTAEDRIAHFLAEPLSYLAVPRSDVESNFSKYGLLDDQVVFLEGLFADTLPKAPIEALAVARLDGDLYESTMDCLVHLYPKLSVGGYMIIDDYGLPLGCRGAVDEYRARHGIEESLTWVNQQTVFWQRIR
jgi:O-methyltransferase